MQKRLIMSTTIGIYVLHIIYIPIFLLHILIGNVKTYGNVSCWVRIVLSFILITKKNSNHNRGFHTRSDEQWYKFELGSYDELGEIEKELRKKLQRSNQKEYEKLNFEIKTNLK